MVAETFDNLTYTVKIAKGKSGDDYLVNASVSGETPKGRPPEKEEARELSDYAQRHGLANLCRLLFNSNEFMFVN